MNQQIQQLAMLTLFRPGNLRKLSPVLFKQCYFSKHYVLEKVCKELKNSPLYAPSTPVIKELYIEINI